MGLETFGEKIETATFERDFAELTEKEKEVKEKIRAIFQENALLNGALVSEDDLDMTEQQRRYYGGKLKGLREESKNTMYELREVTGVEVPKELQGIQAADNYYEEMRRSQVA